MRVALVSLDQAWLDGTANLRAVEDSALRAYQHGADLVAFPEMTFSGFCTDATAALAASDAATMRRAVAELACGRLAIAVGIVEHGANGQAVNKLVVMDRFGALIADYTKVHPFTLSGESAQFAAGSELVTFEVAGARVGCSICYDLRFPALHQAYARDVDAVLNIANWPARRVGHWEALSKARAIENQMFTLGVNRIGVDGNGIEYQRSSVVFGPWGDRVEPVTTDGPIEVYEVDVAAVGEARCTLDVAADRRDALYAGLYAAMAEDGHG